MKMFRRVTHGATTYLLYNLPHIQLEISLSRLFERFSECPTRESHCSTARCWNKSNLSSLKDHSRTMIMWCITFLRHLTFASVLTAALEHHHDVGVLSTICCLVGCEIDCAAQQEMLVTDRQQQICLALEGSSCSIAAVPDHVLA